MLEAGSVDSMEVIHDNSVTIGSIQKIVNVAVYSRNVNTAVSVHNYSIQIMPAPTFKLHRVFTD
jgi:hypothetical protein